ncbi:MAG: arginase family protein [Melioribacteraceae bacterium]|nr:arginase family protein [Melioribacteraceae bacterium]
MKILKPKNNFLQLEEEHSGYNSKIIVLPLSFSDNKKKNEIHPYRFIFDVSKNLERYDEEMQHNIAEEYGICSLPPIKVFTDSNKNGIVTNKLLNEFSQKIIFTISDNVNTLNFIAEYFRNTKNEYSILHLDAKSRMKENHSSESVIRNLTINKIDITQVGIRSLSKDEENYKKENLVKQFLACEINLGMYGNDWQELVVRNLKQNVLIVLNINVFEPYYLDNISEPEPFGLNWNDLIYLFKIIGQDKNIIGVDICGIKSIKRSNSNYFIAKLLYKIMNYAIK